MAGRAGAQPIATPRATRRRRRPTGAAGLRQIGFYVLVLIAVAMSLFPFYWIIRTSLATNAEIAEGVEATGLLPSHLSFSAYVDDFTQQHFLTPLHQQRDRGAGRHAP